MPTMRFDVTTLGEMLLRLSVPSGKRLENANQHDPLKLLTVWALATRLPRA